ncbi:hypothetical protein HZS_211 [Henneguya salminicola]|nr:hypothetical protein HZS_211 [Henneguya salminicola]
MRRKLAEYNTDHDFALAARMIVALFFVSIEDIDVVFEALENEIAKDLKLILNWFENVYIERQNRYRTRRSSLLILIRGLYTREQEMERARQTTTLK